MSSSFVRVFGGLVSDCRPGVFNCKYDSSNNTRSNERMILVSLSGRESCTQQVPNSLL